MGAISFTIDLHLLRELRRHLPLQTFVETGTFQGDTLDLARHEFDECYSAELSQAYYEAAQRRFAGVANIKLFHGDSPTILRGLQPELAGRSALYWLDAHWCAAENTAGEKSQCPLLDELAAIGALNTQSAILIDDARLFLSPPPKPHEISAWPDFDAILQQLRRLSESHAIVYFNDVLVFVPSVILPHLRPYLQENTFNLLTFADKARDYDSVLGQATQKDAAMRQLAAEIELLRTIAAERQAKIEELHVTAAERLVAIQKLDVGLEQTRRLLAGQGQYPNQAGPDLTALTDEVSSLRIQLLETKHHLHDRQIRLQKLELENAARISGLGKRTPWQRLLTRWQIGLAETTPHPLATLQQYPPRPLKLERFPRPARQLKWPRICIATPSFQQAAYLERTMLSVLDQGYPNLAYGVQDGGSTDGSVEIITRHIGRLTHAESVPDKGQSDAIRRGFHKLFPTRHDIMGWLNSDDVLMPGALHYIGEYFARHPEVDVIYGHRVVIDEQDREVGRWFLPRHSKHTLPWFDLVPQETLFWRARCLDQVGGMDPEFHFALDWDLLLRFEQAALTIRRLPYFLGSFRVHTRQKTSAHISTVGEQEMQKLRQRTHGREVPSGEIQKHLEEEIRRSAMVEWLFRHGVRW
jgi:hypothetical protein